MDSAPPADQALVSPGASTDTFTPIDSSTHRITERSVILGYIWRRTIGEIGLLVRARGDA